MKFAIVDFDIKGVDGADVRDKRDITPSISTGVKGVFCSCFCAKNSANMDVGEASFSFPCLADVANDEKSGSSARLLCFRTVGVSAVDISIDCSSSDVSGNSCSAISWFCARLGEKRFLTNEKIPALPGVRGSFCLERVGVDSSLLYGFL